jgi:hypothetical protein
MASDKSGRKIRGKEKMSDIEERLAKCNSAYKALKKERDDLVKMVENLHKLIKGRLTSK